MIETAELLFNTEVYERYRAASDSPLVKAVDVHVKSYCATIARYPRRKTAYFLDKRSQSTAAARAGIL